MTRLRMWTGCVVLALGAAVSASGAAPKLAIDEPNFDFGVIDNSTIVEHDFVIRNDGDVTLEILKAKPSCGCTVASISSKMVAPGSNAVISISLNLHGRQGQQLKTIDVETNDPEKPQTTLVIKGVATTAIEITPRTIQGANLIQGQVFTNVVKVVSNDEKPIVITSVVSTSPDVTAEVVTVEEGKSFDIVVTTSDSLPLGHTSGRITIRTTSERLPQTAIPFQYSVVGELSVSVNEIALITQDKPVARTLVVGPGSVKEFSIEDVQVPDGGMTYQINPLKGNRFRIILSNITPAMDLNGKEVKILTTARNMEEIHIPFRVIENR